MERIGFKCFSFPICYSPFKIIFLFGLVGYLVKKQSFNKSEGGIDCLIKGNNCLLRGDSMSSETRNGLTKEHAIKLAQKKETLHYIKSLKAIKNKKSAK